MQDVIFPPLSIDPLGHTAHTTVADLFDAVPFKHFLQSVAPSMSLYDPGAHDKQSIRPAVSEKYPGLHKSQLPLLDRFRKLPALHDMHVLTCVMPIAPKVDVPREQFLHDISPLAAIRLLYVSLGHMIHVWKKSSYVPGGQS